VVASFGAIEEVIGQSILERDDDAAPGSTSMTTIMRARTASIFASGAVPGHGGPNQPNRRSMDCSY
jgi:hypothetical protein